MISTPLIRRLSRWHQTNHRAFPWRRTRNPYRVLLAEILLQQTPYWKVEPAYRAILKIAPSPAILATLSSSKLKPLIRPLGLEYRARLLIQLGRALVRWHRARVPKERADLLALPGVGPYIGNAVRVMAFEVAEPLVDRLTARFYERYFRGRERISQPVNDGLWNLVSKVQPKRPRQFHLAVIDLASTICRPKVPLCSMCPVAASCRSSRFFMESPARPPAIHATMVRRKAQNR